MCSLWSSAAINIIPPSSSSSSSSSSSATRICVPYRAATPISKMDSFSSRRRRRLNYGFLTSNSLLFRLPTPKPNAPRPLILMEMQTCTVKMEVDVPTSVAYQCYSDREAIPKWMPFISSVKVLEDKPDQSRWTLKYKAFGRDIEFSWLARNLQPIPNQKIHWRSLEGLPNSGVVRFYPRGSSSCFIELSVSYEVPQLLAPVTSALQPFLESLLIRGLERFSNFAKNRQT